VEPETEHAGIGENLIADSSGSSTIITGSLRCEQGRIGLPGNRESFRWAGPCLGRSILLYNNQKKVLFYKINKNH
jgi:hypothetical protein